MFHKAQLPLPEGYWVGAAGCANLGVLWRPAGESPLSWLSLASIGSWECGREAEQGEVEGGWPHGGLAQEGEWSLHLAISLNPNPCPQTVWP